MHNQIRHKDPAKSTPAGAMSVKIEAFITRANEKTTDLTFGQQPSLLLDTGFQRMQQDPTAGSSIGYSQPEELQPRDGSSIASSANVREDRVPIPPASATRASGPMSSTVVIPNRPKPGRKPIAQEDAADRRRVQNRLAQRSFRDKRQQKLADTQLELEEKKREYEQNINNLQRKLDTERREKQDLATQLKEAEARAENAEVKLRQVQALNNATGFFGAAPSLSVNTNQRAYGGYGAASHPTPPEDSASAFGHLEQDFTSYRTSTTQNGLRQTNSNDSMDFTTNMSSDCGFCTDDQNCACKQGQQGRQIAEQCAPVPGTCAGCRADPVRAQACRELATIATFNSRPPTADEAGQFAPRMSCSQLVGQFRQFGERPGSISEIFSPGQINAYPQVGGGYDVDQQEAAEVLQTLSRRNTVISPTDVSQNQSQRLMGMRGMSNSRRKD
ncbi:hypothetical protein LTR56_022430 [Elasticomyces elasticus]|nr:hypothetical protein LTR56_022430 [Elasticomyces elasticus]KAK4932732.1 hypothetical protein LTR49_001156 [Elasticomyces elasticus]KAK5769755.1 hypothetical protein LTS12_000205 [Elasticomyces elasticus]